MSHGKLKLGIVGMGGMGSSHASYLVNMDSVEVVGVCDIEPERADQAAVKCQTQAYYNHLDLFEHSGLEAVLIATSHYAHTPISVDAFEHGLHVLCEKPIAVHVNDAEKTIKAYEKARQNDPKVRFGIMFQERTLPAYIKLKDILAGGELGKLIRVTWINTAWYRTQAYYNSGGWRATWAGEGGGILTNQCPHNLDMYQWLFGLPARIHGFASIGKYHDIEVEDEVTAYFEHANGMVGHFIVTTGEFPGTNRLEIAGEIGKVVCENGKIVFYRNRQSMLQHLQESTEVWSTPENWYTEIPVDQGKPVGHQVVTERFVQAILNGNGDLIAEGCDGVNGLTLANGIMLSSFTGATQAVPVDGDAFEAELKTLIASSKYVKPAGTGVQMGDLSKSFTKQ